MRKKTEDFMNDAYKFLVLLLTL